MAFWERRKLYDLDWIEHGCNGSYPNGTIIDDTFGTYVSNYLIGSIGLIAAVVMATDAKATNLYKISSICYFTFTAIGYTIAGVLHQILHVDTQPSLPKYKIWWTFSFVGVLIGSAALCVLGNHLLPWPSPIVKMLDGIVLAIHAAIIIENFIDPQMIATGALSGTVVLYLLAVWAATCQWGKAFSMFSCAVGFVTEASLAIVCGDDAYKSCFAECPLPAPYFNHNALFHVLYALGIAGIGIAMKLNPEQCRDGGTYGECVSQVWTHGEQCRDGGTYGECASQVWSHSDMHQVQIYIRAC